MIHMYPVRVLRLNCPREDSRCCPPGWFSVHCHFRRMRAKMGGPRRPVRFHVDIRPEPQNENTLPILRYTEVPGVQQHRLEDPVPGLRSQRIEAPYVASVPLPKQTSDIFD